MAKHQYCSFGIAFNHFGHTCERAKHGRHQQIRACSLERAISRGHDHQQAFATLQLQVGVFDCCTQARLVLVQPGLSDFRIWHWNHANRCGLAVFGSAIKRPPPILGRCCCRSCGASHYLFFLRRGIFFGRVGTKWPPAESAFFGFGYSRSRRRCGSFGDRRSYFSVCRLGRCAGAFIGRRRRLVGRAQLPPFVATCGVILWSLCTTGNCQAKSQSEGLIR